MRDIDKMDGSISCSLQPEYDIGKGNGHTILSYLSDASNANAWRVLKKKCPL